MAGAGLARGYAGRPGLTAERFVACPFGGRGADVPDRGPGPVEPDGPLEFAGRVDEQVKIRGFRVEPGEVQAVLAAYPGVAQAAVSPARTPPARPAAGRLRRPRRPARTAGLATALREHAAGRLPEYMVPAAVITLDALPVTANGKLDRRRCPAPDYAPAGAGPRPGHARARRSCARRSPRCWACTAVGPDDDFFALGGHSLLAVQLVEWLRERGEEVPVRALFETPTPAGLAAAGGRAPGRGAARTGSRRAAADDHAGDAAAGRLDRRARSPRCRAGARRGRATWPTCTRWPRCRKASSSTTWSATSSDVYVPPIVLRFDSRDRLDSFLAALQQVIDRHDVYRTALVWEGLTEPVQVVWRQAACPSTEVELAADTTGDAVRQLLAAAGPRMDLRPGAADAACTVAAEPGTRPVDGAAAMHHLVWTTPGWMWCWPRSRRCWPGGAGSCRAPMPFRDFVAQARLGISRDEHEPYFAGLLGDVTEPTAPFGLLDVHGDGTATVEARRAVDADLAERVREQARRLGVSPGHAVPPGRGRACWRSLAGRDDVVFGTVLLGPDERRAGADRVLGPFINTLPVRVRCRRPAAWPRRWRRCGPSSAGLLAHEHAPLAVAQQASGVPAPAPRCSPRC